MKGCLKYVVCVLAGLLFAVEGFAQKNTHTLYIPLQYGHNIEMNPRIDTLENGKEYIFRINVTDHHNVTQFLFEGGLAVQNDSVLSITANSSKNGGYDTAILRVIVTNEGGKHIWPYQKVFIVKVPERSFPVLNKNNNIIMVNDRVTLERNNTYAKSLFADNSTFVTMYDNAANMNKLEVKQVTVSLMEKEGKQFISKGDTISLDAIHELKKIKKPTTVYIRVEGKSGKQTKTVWNRIVVYNEE